LETTVDLVVFFRAVIRVLMQTPLPQRREALRDNPNNSCKADYRFRGCLPGYFLCISFSFWTNPWKIIVKFVDEVLVKLNR